MSERSLEEIISEYNVEPWLAIGAGELPTEVDLRELSSELENQYSPKSVEYDPAESSGLDFSPEGTDGLPLHTFYTSGKYILRTGDEEKLYEANDDVLNMLASLGVITYEEKEQIEFTVSNIACTADIGTHFKLSPLAVGLGFQNAEYEPEQFPAVIYRSDEYTCTFSIFGSGAIVFPGSKSTDDALRSLDKFIEEELSMWTATAGTDAPQQESTSGQEPELDF